LIRKQRHREYSRTFNLYWLKVFFALGALTILNKF
jgi:hypothetical protein